MSSLEERVKQLEALVTELQDDRAIRELLARYGFNADLDRTDPFVNLWTEDGVMDLGSGGKLNRWAGKEELQGWITTTPARLQPEKFGKRMHAQGNNVVCHINGDKAIVNAYSLVIRLQDGKPTLTGVGANRWTLRKVDGKWLIKERFRRELGGVQYEEALADTPE